RLSHLPIQLESVLKFDCGMRVVLLFQQLHATLVVALRSFFGSTTARASEEAEDHNGRRYMAGSENAHSKHDHPPKNQQEPSQAVFLSPARPGRKALSRGTTTGKKVRRRWSASCSDSRAPTCVVKRTKAPSVRFCNIASSSKYHFETNSFAIFLPRWLNQ